MCLSARQTAAFPSRSISTQLRQARYKCRAGRCRSSRLQHLNTSCTLESCRQLRLVYNSGPRAGTASPGLFGAGESFRIRVRLHDDFFISSSGRKHGGDITIRFQDVTGAASSYGEWRQRRETPAVPVTLCGLEQGVYGLQVDTEPRGRKHVGDHLQPEGSAVIACSAHDNAQTEQGINGMCMSWGFGNTQVYADGVLAVNVKDLVLPDHEGIPWHYVRRPRPEVSVVLKP